MRKGLIKIVIAEIIFLVILGGIIAYTLYDRTPEDVSLSDIAEDFEAEFDTSCMQKSGAMRIKRAFGINPSDYEDYLYYMPANTMDVDELLIVKTGDESLNDALVRAVNERLDSQKKTFDGYGTDQLDILKGAQIFTAGQYVCFMVSGEADRWLDFIKQEIKIK